MQNQSSISDRFYLVSQDTYAYRHFTTRLLLRDLRFGRAAPSAGDPLPRCELIGTRRERIWTTDYVGVRPVLLVFGSVTCPMTASAMPSLKRLHDEFGRSVAFVMVNVREAHPGEHYPQPETLDEKLEHAKALEDLYQIPWTVASDDIHGSLNRALDPKPNAAFLADVNGTIVFRSLWASDESALRRALESVVRGVEPPEPESRAMILPVSRAMGHVQDVTERAGPQVMRDLWRAGFPMALAGRLATVFAPLSRDARGVAAVVTLAFSALALLVGLIYWLR